MSVGHEKGTTIIRDLGDGLILRNPTAEDTEALVEMNADVLRNYDATEPDETVAAWTRELMGGGHPTVGLEDITVMEDTRTGALVSSVVLISQMWSYGGVEVPVGLPELVSTRPEYRRRGLIRAQMEVLHARSTGRGHLLQAILGIPWYYRQFGYEMALEAHGGTRVYLPQIPKLKEGEGEPYRIRPAAESDLPLMATLYDVGMKRYRVSGVRDLDLWRYELLRRDQGHTDHREFRILETPVGEPVGFLAHPSVLWGSAMAITMLEVKPGIGWFQVMPPVLRYLRTAGEEIAGREGRPCDALMIVLGTAHPTYEALPAGVPRETDPYAFYLRIPDLPSFLRHVAPALEDRLRESVLCGHTGELKLSFYRGGLQLTFEEGHLTAVESWEPGDCQDGNAAFPGLIFLQLLMGFRSLKELRYAFPDCWANGDETEALLNALFPKQASLVWQLA